MGFVLLLVFSNPYLSQHAMRLWEIEAINLKNNKQHDAIIILGGFATSIDVNGTRRTVFADGNDRAMQAIELFNRGIAPKIIYTAGTDSVFNKTEPESFLTKRYMLMFGIPDSCITTEAESVNTYENAVFTRELLKTSDPEWNEKNYIIVTSAFHMRRAIACFKKAGFKHITPYSTDIRSIRNKNTIINTVIPAYSGIQNFTILLKELIGMAVYKIKGYI